MRRKIISWIVRFGPVGLVRQQKPFRVFWVYPDPYRDGFRVRWLAFWCFAIRFRSKEERLRFSESID